MPIVGIGLTLYVMSVLMDLFALGLAGKRHRQLQPVSWAQSSSDQTEPTGQSAGLRLCLPTDQTSALPRLQDGGEQVSSFSLIWLSGFECFAKDYECVCISNWTLSHTVIHACRVKSHQVLERATQRIYLLSACHHKNTSQMLVSSDLNIIRNI